MGMLTNKRWWAAAGIRALKTVAQSFLAVLSTAVLISDVNWIQVLSAAALSGLLSLFTSLAGLPEVTLEEEKADDDAA